MHPALIPEKHPMCGKVCVLVGFILRVVGDNAVRPPMCAWDSEECEGGPLRRVGLALCHSRIHGEAILDH
jgi:hypothetical protein